MSEIKLLELEQELQRVRAHAAHSGHAAREDARPEDASPEPAAAAAAAAAAADGVETQTVGAVDLEAAIANAREIGREIGRAEAAEAAADAARALDAARAEAADAAADAARAFEAARKEVLSAQVIHTKRITTPGFEPPTPGFERTNQVADSPSVPPVRRPCSYTSQRMLRFCPLAGGGGSGGG